MRNNYRIGTAVQFDSDEGTLTGKFTGTIPSLVNGEQHGLVELDHSLDGIIYRVPMRDIELRTDVKQAA